MLTTIGNIQNTVMGGFILLSHGANATLTFFTKPLKCLSYKRGGMAERLNALVLKLEHNALYPFTPYLNPFKSTLKIS